MTIRDLLITPLLIALILFFAYWLRPYLTTKATRKYFIPALLLKIIGAISVGLIYQFYYSGGDTFTYFNLGSVHIWEAFLDSPGKAFSLIFGPDDYTAYNYDYASRIYSFGDRHSFFVVRVAGFLGLLTFNSYSAIAVLFAVLSFSGIWSMYVSIHKLYPRLGWPLAVAILFIPSVVFWGSGLLKDTLTLGALGWMTWAIVNIFIQKRKYLISGLALGVSVYVIYIVKIYILLSIIPAVLLWIMLANLRGIRSPVVKVLAIPTAFIFVGLIAYSAILVIGDSSHRYSLDKFNYTAETTAKWNYYVSQQEGGSGYTLGDSNDFTTAGMLSRSPEAVWVALFRPYIWESSNSVMFISAIENFLLLLFSVYVLFKAGLKNMTSIIRKEPFVFFSLVFAIVFAFAIGISTYNFGTLVRYKIPLLPFYTSALVVILGTSGWQKKIQNRERNKPAFEVLE